MKTAIKITREENFNEWYQEVVKEAELADNSSTRGCMVVRPYAYAIWEKMQAVLNEKIKRLGVQNAYFPLLIPIDFFQKEAEHVEGFAKECAVVTHHKLKLENGKLIPDGELEKPYIIRPTSETIIGESFAKWINSYRDLPMKINQWSNVFRWEMRTRMFLRTSEFLWQEGHNVFATAIEAEEDAKKMINVYNDFFVNYLAIEGAVGTKTQDEKFAGALNTYTIEAIMQDKKALQGCTSHDLGQNFTKSSNIKFTNEETQEQLAFSSSWGTSTRMIGALILSHSDDNGLVLPPKIAPYPVVIIPVIHKEEDKNDILDYCNKIADSLKVDYYIDDRAKKPQDKKWEWVKKGAPIRLEIGKKEVENQAIFYVRRDNLEQKNIVNLDDFLNSYENILDEMQKNLLKSNQLLMKNNIIFAENLEEIKSKINENKFISIPKKIWGDEELAVLMDESSFTYRCIPFADKERIIIAKSY